VAGAELVLGRRITAIDANAKRLTDDRGVTYQYERLLLATGGAPRTLPPPAAQAIVYFRTLDDYRRLRAAADAKRRFAVIGGGFIGSEVAAALRLQGCEVGMVIPEAGIGARVFPAELAAHLADFYRGKGVDVRTGEGVASVTARGAGLAITTTLKREIATDVVVAGLGIIPSVELATQAGLSIDNGIVVDDLLRATRVEIFAAGDVAAFPSAALGRRVRVEHEDNANAQGRAAGRNMAGAAESYRHLPFFYGDLFELGYEAVGDLDARLETYADWREPFREGVIYYLKDGRVRGVLLWNTWNQVDHARALIAERGPFTAATLKGRLPAA
jgi:NADPH-dependent 2,4-dienoyl-CoA reductase/sulfur reductase-like enzyme